jgi:hypothetical protein
MSYKVWRADEGEEDGSAKTYPRTPPSPSANSVFVSNDTWALDDHDAVMTYADYCHSQRDGWEWSWPTDFLVRDMKTNTVQKFNVDREEVPEFHAGKGVVVEPGPHDRENLPPDDECPCGHPYGFAGPCVKTPGWGTPCKCGVAPAPEEVLVFGEA